MRAGALRHTIVVEQPNRTPDGMGGYSIAWAVVDTVRANVEQLSGTKAVRMGKVSGATVYRILIRYNSAVDIKQRILWDGRYLDITQPPRDLTGKKSEMEIIAEEGTAQ